MSNIDHFADRVVAHLRWLVNNNQKSAIAIYIAEQNLLPMAKAITELVAEIENWDHMDNTSLNSFEVARQRLYLVYGIFVNLFQKELSHPGHSFMSLDVDGFNKVFYDLELNACDPYFDPSKRDYYNEVSN